jgi:hypothetical protein
MFCTFHSFIDFAFDAMIFLSTIALCLLSLCTYGAWVFEMMFMMHQYSSHEIDTSRDIDSVTSLLTNGLYFSERNHIESSNPLSSIPPVA